LIGSWKAHSTKYPIPAGEAQGGIIGHDLVIVSGFTLDYGQATPQCYALNLHISGSTWRRMDDYPIVNGITHAAFVIDGLKLYICGGYVCGCSSQQVFTHPMTRSL
jgi:N-acetylneuraminic acid mutarotase